jgi:hypothetical protein
MVLAKKEKGNKNNQKESKGNQYPEPLCIY